MKLLTILILGIMIASCTNTSDKQERMSREPVKYWNFEEVEKDFVKEADEETVGNIYYWSYDGEE